MGDLKFLAQRQRHDSLLQDVFPLPRVQLAEVTARIQYGITVRGTDAESIQDAGAGVHLVIPGVKSDH